MKVYDLGTILIVVGIIIAGIVAAGGIKNLDDGVQRCIAYKTWKQEWIAKGKPGGAAEERRVLQFYAITTPICANRGVIIP